MMALLKYHTRFHKLPAIFLCVLKQDFIYFYFRCMIFFWIYMHHINAWYPPGRQKKLSGALELESEMAVNHGVNSGN